LSKLNTRLLKQRGATGEPTNRLREASDKLTSMASVISKLKSSSGSALDNPLSDASISVAQLRQRAEQTNDPLIQGILAALVQDIHRSM
jgi:hypothetical protein